MQLPLAFLDGALRTFPFRDVHGHGQDERLFRHGDRAGRDQNVAVPDARKGYLHIHGIDGSAPLQDPQHLLLLGLLRDHSELLRGPADDLLLAQPEGLAEMPVHVNVAAGLRIVQGDRAGAGIEDDPELLLALPDLFLRPPAFGQVQADRHDARLPADVHLRGHEVVGNAPSVLHGQRGFGLGLALLAKPPEAFRHAAGGFLVILEPVEHSDLVEFFR